MGESPDAGHHAASRRWEAWTAPFQWPPAPSRRSCSPSACCRCWAKGARTRDLASYSRSNLVLANVGNAFYSLYVFHLPPGPIWLLHTFYAVTSALMLLWSVRYGRPTATPRSTLCVPNTSKP